MQVHVSSFKMCKKIDIYLNSFLANGHAIFTAKKNKLEGKVFDGMTIDTEGNLYVATWGGSVIKIDPRKPETLLDTIEMPAKIVSKFATKFMIRSTSKNSNL